MAAIKVVQYDVGVCLLCGRAHKGRPFRGVKDEAGGPEKPFLLGVKVQIELSPQR